MSNIREDIKNTNDIHDKAINDAKKSDNPNDEYVLKLYKHVSQSVASVFEHEAIKGSIERLAKNINQDKSSEISDELTLIVATVFASCATDAIIFYDDIVKEQLGGYINDVGNSYNEVMTKLSGIDAVLEIHKNKISEIVKESEVEKVKKKNNI